jgi:cobalt/nickel transport protein
MRMIKKLWIGLGVLIVISPIGLILPEKFKSGSAWGEWGKNEMKELAGYIPQGLEKLASLWKAPMQDYAFKGWEGKDLSHLSLAYIASAVAGIAVIIAVVLFIGKLLTKKGDQ